MALGLSPFVSSRVVMSVLQRLRGVKLGRPADRSNI